MDRRAHSQPSVVDGPRGTLRIGVVGPDTRFLSGITYYTYGLLHVLSADFAVSAILLRRLLPRRLYPGHSRVGSNLTELHLPEDLTDVVRLDWYWGGSMLAAMRLLWRRRLDVLLLEWWTGTVLHTYLLLALVSRFLGGTVVIEFHEALDTGEDRIGAAKRYVSACAPLLMRLSTGFVVHSEHDRTLISERFGISSSRLHVIPHPTYVNYRAATARSTDGNCRLLYFGVVRPFKGVEDLIRAFEALPHNFELTIAGETWENWTEPDMLARTSPAHSRIHRIDRYLTDREATALFAACDVVVLPYRRSSQSGPLHIAMACGLPVVTTRVGGLPEATSGYDGAVLAAPGDPSSLREAIITASNLRGRHFEGAPTWQDVAPLYAQVLRISARAARRGRPPKPLAVTGSGAEDGYSSRSPH